MNDEGMATCPFSPISGALSVGGRREWAGAEKSGRKKTRYYAGFSSVKTTNYLAGIFLTGFLLFFGLLVAFIMIVFPFLKLKQYPGFRQTPNRLLALLRRSATCQVNP